MTLGALSGSHSPPAVSFCSCCGARMVPYFSDNAVMSKNQINQLISESFLTVKGPALCLPGENGPTPTSATCANQHMNKPTDDLQKHLQTMFTVLRPDDTIKLAVRLESSSLQVTHYMVVVSTNGRQDTEESIVLGMDFVSSDSFCTVGLVLPLWSDTRIHLDGDGGFSVSTVNRVHVFKPVSVQAMWSALQSLHKACDIARCHNYYPGSLFLTWVSYYQSRISSNQFCINEWNAMQDVESHRANSPILFTDLPTERERTERLIKQRLREIMMQKDLEKVTCKEIRTELEMQMVCNLREFKEFIDNEMIVILGQMDSPTEIFDHVYLGSEWNASNLEELQNNGVRYILNVTREIDNFFPGMFEYHNIRVYDEEATNLLEYWNETYKFISKARKAGAKCLVHCKMGISRSASTVIAYAMKEYGWNLDAALKYVKDKRAVTKPNPSFMNQLEEYQGILLASKQRHNKLWRSHSDGDLSDRPEKISKTPTSYLGHSNSQNKNSSSPSLPSFLGVESLGALTAEHEDFVTSDTASTSDSHTESADMCDPAHQEDTESSCDPQAATVVLEENLDMLPTVTVTAPPAPEPQCALQNQPNELSFSTSQHKTQELCLKISEQSSSEEVSAFTLKSTDSDTKDQSLTNLRSDLQNHLSPAKISPPPLVIPLAPTDNNNNNNPSESQTESGFESHGEVKGSSNHIVDTTDFSSTREKLPHLTKDARSATPSQRKQQRLLLSLEENGATVAENGEEQGNRVSAQFEDSPDTPYQPQHDTRVSVRHIVTEIEASCLPAPSSSSFLPSSLHIPQLQPGDQDSEITNASPLYPSALSILPCDLPEGLVRQATEQLEQKLKHEIETAAISQGKIMSESVKSKEGEKQMEFNTELQRLDSSLTDSLPNHSSSTISNISKDFCVSDNFDIHILESSLDSHSQSEELAKDTSAQSQTQIQQPCSYPATREVDMQQSGSDKMLGSHGVRPALDPGYNGFSRLTCSSQELKRIQQALRELQAFLQKHVGLETTDSQEGDVGQLQSLKNVSDTELRPREGTGSEQTPQGLHEGHCHREIKGTRSYLALKEWYRAVELEACIRHAGLTPPSLMKRSASLAKLDSLDLSANDLRLHTSATSSDSQDSFPISHPDDALKKQKVLGQNKFKIETQMSRDVVPSFSSTSVYPISDSTCHPEGDTGRREGQDSSGSGSATSARQQGRGHSSKCSRKVSVERM
ncbi:protein phosphatase Slingshot homolog 2 [Cheilinus undulatus]|uniref:protein phosphatase Slingshot homolog 2 n=1 Tax=Cheilinus undulatus TaxID=241271 RepID=UPI001BD46A52|nr:protein phosphatase Slingshot homolog 2 [Cheilinus undulatus]